MHAPKLIATLALAVSAFGFDQAQAAAPDDALAKLRKENAELRAKISTLEAACPTPTASAAPAAATTVAPVTPDSITPPAGYALVKVEPVEPYSQTGCKKYSGAVDTRWKVSTNWEYVGVGQSMAEVEELLGIEHYDVKNDRRIGWEYGKCGDAVKGRVIFEGGKVLYWTKPIF